MNIVDRVLWRQTHEHLLRENDTYRSFFGGDLGVLRPDAQASALRAGPPEIPDPKPPQAVAAAPVEMEGVFSPSKVVPPVTPDIPRAALPTVAPSEAVSVYSSAFARVSPPEPLAAREAGQRDDAPESPSASPSGPVFAVRPDPLTTIPSASHSASHSLPSSVGDDRAIAGQSSPPAPGVVVRPEFGAPMPSPSPSPSGPPLAVRPESSSAIPAASMSAVRQTSPATASSGRDGPPPAPGVAVRPASGAPMPAMSPSRLAASASRSAAESPGPAVAPPSMRLPSLGVSPGGGSGRDVTADLLGKILKALEPDRETPQYRPPAPPAPAPGRPFAHLLGGS